MAKRATKSRKGSSGDDPAASYIEAASEVDSILGEIEGEGELDIDALAGKVERAAELILFCNERLKHAETRVRQVAEKLAVDAEPANGSGSSNSGNSNGVASDGENEPPSDPPPPNYDDDEIPF